MLGKLNVAFFETVQIKNTMLRRLCCIFSSFRSSSSVNPYGSPSIIRFGVWVVSVFSILWMKWRQSIGFRKFLRLLHSHRQYIRMFGVCATEYEKKRPLEKSYTFICTKSHIHHIFHCKWNLIYSSCTNCCCCCCYCLSFGISTIVWLCSCWYVRMRNPFVHRWKCPCRPWSLNVPFEYLFFTLLLYRCRAFRSIAELSKPTGQWKINDLRFRVNKFQTFSAPELHFIYVKTCDRANYPANEKQFLFWIIPIFEWMTQFHLSKERTIWNLNVHRFTPHFNWNKGIEQHMMTLNIEYIEYIIEMRERASMK